MKSLSLMCSFFITFFFAAQSFALCVTTDRANLRKGPGPNFKITWTVGKFMPLKKISRQGSWLKVQDVDNEMHWIQVSAVSEAMSCVVVKARTAVLRQAATVSSTPAEYTVVDRYTPFKKLDRNGEYIQVANEYESFWIKDSAVWYPVNKMTLTF